MKREVLLSNQPRPNPRSQMLIQKLRHRVRPDVFARLEKPPGKNGDRIRVSLDQIRQDSGKPHFLLDARDPLLLIRQQGRQRVDVIFMNPGNVGVGCDDEGEVSDRLETMCQPDRQQ